MLDMAKVTEVQGVAKDDAYSWHSWSSSLQDAVHKVRYASWRRMGDMRYSSTHS